MPLWLASVALVAIVLALLAAFITVMPRPKPRTARSSTQTTVPVEQPTVVSVPTVSATQNQSKTLWPILLPWAIGLDVAALLGLILILVVRANVRVTVGRGK